MVKIIGLLRENKEGLILGAIAGWIVGKFIAPTFIDLSVLTQTQGILDPIISGGKSLVEIGKSKLTIMTTILGAGIGVVIDMLVPEGKFFRRRR